MKTTIAASFSLAVLLFAQPSFAKSNDQSDTRASELFGMSALSVVAAPVLLTAGTGCLIGSVIDKTVDGAAVVGQSAGRIVKLVGESGEALSELTSETIATASDVTIGDSDVKVEVGKKQIPLNVRKDYLQLNQKVKTE
jgi:hypothetical protein